MLNGVAITQPATILVVDDEPSLRDALAYSLRLEGWNVVLAEDGPQALAIARSREPDLILLDVMLPGLDGLQVCRALRQVSNTPILFLSARGEEIDRVIGLELGADDYIAKPFAMRELIARVRANLRRAPAGAAMSDLTGQGEERSGRERREIVSGRVRIDLLARSVTAGGEAVSLKPKEFDLLVYLARNAGQAMSRQNILRDVWQHEFQVDTRTVDVHIHGLRLKLEASPGAPALIETVRGFGYRFVALAPAPPG